MNKLTKIVATIGPSSDSASVVENLIRAGVNVFRFNMKHSTVLWHEERIKLVCQVADKLNEKIGILIDLQGPELRLETKGGENIKVKKDEEVLFTSSFLPNVSSIAIPFATVFEDLKKDDLILVDDGFLEFKVLRSDSNSVLARSLQDGEIKTRKGVNFPGKKINLSSLIADDLTRLDMASKNKIDFVALSFSRTKKDIQLLKKELEKRKMNASVVAKIESQEALDNVDDLIFEADAIMIARGDLGVGTPIERLTHRQKMIIKKCREAKKPVITATQMLESMTNNPMPTRAEATDVSNAVFDGTDALMLSAETASGKYPLRAVSAMAKIASFNEKIAELDDLRVKPAAMTEQIVHAAFSIVEHSTLPKIDAILVFTETGKTARDISRYRLKIPVFAISENKHVVDQLTLSFGVFPVFNKFETALDSLKEKGLIKKGQYLLFIHGEKLRVEGLTNTLTIYLVE